MKIGIVLPYDAYGFGGVKECVFAHRDELKSLGYEVKIIAPRPEKVPEEQDPEVILLGQATKVNTPMHTTVDLAMTVDGDEIDALLEREQFDIMHFHEPWVPVLSRQILSRSKVPNIATFHAKLPDTVLNKSIEKAIIPYTKSLLKYIDYFVAVSDAAADYVSSLTDERIEIVPNGIDLEKFRIKNVTEPALYDKKLKTILYVGRLEKRKGVQYLLKAYRRLIETNPDVRLVLGGDGPLREKCEAYVEKHQLSNVHFLGFISEDDKLNLLKNADVFCSPALYGESFGIVLLEAMAMGTAIVAGNNPGYTFVMRDRGRLSIVDPKETSDFASKLDMMLVDTELNALMSKWGLKEVQQYNYPDIVQRYAAIYKELDKTNG